MRNPLKRLARRDAPKVPLRARLDAVKARLAASKVKVGRIVRVNRVLLADTSHLPAPGVDRVALVNYSTFLSLERERIQAELYPHLSWRSRQFILSMNAAWRFFHDGGNSVALRKDLTSASTRAVRVLDLVGVPWRSDCNEGARQFFDEGDRRPTGEALPDRHVLVEPDAVLVEAVSNLLRIDRAIVALGDDEVEAGAVPGFDGLDEARDEVLATLLKWRPKTLSGLQAKARAILSDSIRGDHLTTEDLAKSLARDLLGSGLHVLEPAPDPIFAAIEEVKRLEAECDAAEAAVPPGQDVPDEIGSAVWRYVDGTLLKTVPRTAEGCKALAAFVPALFARWGQSFDCGKGAAAFALIARSPLL